MVVVAGTREMEGEEEEGCFFFFFFFFFFFYLKTFQILQNFTAIINR